MCIVYLILAFSLLFLISLLLSHSSYRFFSPALVCALSHPLSLPPFNPPSLPPSRPPPALSPSLCPSLQLFLPLSFPPCLPRSVPLSPLTESIKDRKGATKYIYIYITNILRDVLHVSCICIFYLHVTNTTHEHTRPAFDLVQVGKVLHNSTHILRDMLHILFIYIYEFYRILI